MRKLEKHAADSAAMGAHAISALSPTAVGASDTANRENAKVLLMQEQLLRGGAPLLPCIERSGTQGRGRVVVADQDLVVVRHQQHQQCHKLPEAM